MVKQAHSPFRLSQKLEYLRYFGAHTFFLGGYTIHNLTSRVPTEAKLSINGGRGKHQLSVSYSKPADPAEQTTIHLGYGVNLTKYSGRLAVQTEHGLQADSHKFKLQDIHVGIEKTVADNLSVSSKYALWSGVLSYHTKYRLSNKLAVQGSFQTAVGAGRGVYKGYRHYPFKFGLKLQIDL